MSCLFFRWIFVTFLSVFIITANFYNSSVTECLLVELSWNSFKQTPHFRHFANSLFFECQPQFGSTPPDISHKCAHFCFYSHKIFFFLNRLFAGRKSEFFVQILHRISFGSCFKVLAKLGISLKSSAASGRVKLLFIRVSTSDWILLLLFERHT